MRTGCIITETLPDIIAERLAVLFCGINSGMEAAATGHHFIGRANRFWQVIHLAGFTPDSITPEDDRAILRHGCGLTSMVERPTARADQLSPQDNGTTLIPFEELKSFIASLKGTPVR